MQKVRKIIYFSKSWEDREMSGQTEKHDSKNYHTTTRSNKKDKDNNYC